MALTNAERKKKYLDKLKATGQYESFKKKKAADEKCRQDRIKNGLQQLPKAVREKTKRLNRDYNRKKAAEYRRRKKEKMGFDVEDKSVQSQTKEEANKSNELGAYNTASALSKAVAKIKRACPSSSDKKRTAVKKILRTFDPKELQEIIDVAKKPKPKGTKGIKPDVIEAIKTFYERDDISRISPNMRDFRKFKNPVTGIKEQFQIRYLMFKLSDVHQLFLQHTKNGNVQQNEPVGLSKFCSLRPSHVKLVNCTPLDQCLCLYHQNFIVCCKAVHQNLPEFPEYGKQLESLLLCENPIKDCWFRACSKCPNVKRKLADIMKRSRKTGKTSVMWCQWNKNKETNRFEKCMEKGTLASLIRHFLDILPEFLKHSHIKRCQATQFQNDDEEVRKSKGVIATLQVDFAESFNCEAQDEIQTAHWNQAAVSLFTACMKCCEEIFPKAISSDNTSHSKNEIACYMFKIIAQIPSTVKMLKIWSDGPNNQFKNRFIAALIKVFETYKKIKIFWNFFATAHGKGSVDGIGAVVKNRVKRLVKSRHSIVNCSNDFCESFNSEDSVIELINMAETEFIKIRETLKLDSVFANAQAVAEVFSFHQLQCIDGKIKGFITSQEGYDYFDKNC